jgi:putative CocE/NonD family hydrolase
MANGSADRLDGLALMMTLSNFRDELLSFGGFTQAGTLGWTELMRPLVDFVPGFRLKRPNPHSLDHVHGHLPVGTLDEAAFGESVGWWKDWTNHPDPDDPWWRAIDHSAAVPALTAPTTMVAGWQDVFLPFQLRDFQARQAAGREAWLTIGPWSHSALGGMSEGLRHAVTMFTALSAGKALYPDRDKVRLYLQGAGVWHDYPTWPPPGGQPLRFHLRSGGTLDPAPSPGTGGSTAYVFDPADPTPAVHGPMVMGASKHRNMAALEQREDSVAFTSAPLDRDVDAIGPVAVELSVRSDRDHTDFYACLCDVDAKGRAMHVCDGYVRLGVRQEPGTLDADASGVRQVAIECWPTAYRFKRGHKLRLMIASGAHPRYSRNLGTGEPLATAMRMARAHQEILHGGGYNSSITLTAASQS